ncbi:T9SS type A sorting domain-containing protein [Phaeodactylibacter luteus]|uniref:T9SS type A sorting domain-containing protein n=1 Tax=Phaeodactylibacter luteus TaxID=1564516 RepID=A0A5C6RI67_9BACT|nr:T9SS type A sorting domain-containing protein [Phaeodactylibacter luteus]TXB62128.1 T9SS type A sorting domain-containing protein [Phaeodactylibacter luteus]
MKTTMTTPYVAGRRPLPRRSLQFLKHLPLFLLLLLAAGQAGAQDFMMQGWYWDYPKPNCNGYSGPSIASEMAARAAAQREAGFTMMWMPPMAKASFGDCSNGYDPKDLYDYGQVTGQTGLGTGAEVEAWISALQANNIFPVADVVYNHRDGGDWETNPAVRDYVLNYPNGGGCSGGSGTPYPVNGKMRYALPLGGSSGNGAGDYYIKFSSASGNGGFNGRQYKLFFRTKNTGFNPVPINEAEPNGGGDCGQPSNQVFLGQDVFAVQEVGGGCNTDEFYLALGAGDFDPSGDLLEIYIEQVGGGGTGIDQRIYGLYSVPRSADIMGDLQVQTRTDFTSLPSGQGAMNFRNFKPNGTNPTCMSGDEEFPFFFFDVEQAYDGSLGGQSTRQVYSDWNRWLWEQVGVRGFRMDAVKHFPASFVGQLLNDLHADGHIPPMVVGEHFTVDAGVLKGWIDGVYAAMTPAAASAIQVRAFDFELRAALKEACDNGLFDVRNIYNRGLVDGQGMNGANAVTFINNHDYRTAPEHVINRQMLAYAYILTNNRVGLPSVFYPDYYGVDIYGASNPLAENKAGIDELMEVHKNYITGADFVDYLNRFGTPYGSIYQQSGAFDHLLYQIQGGPAGKDVIVVINFEGQPLQFNHTINTGNAPLGTTFNLIAGNANFESPVVENNAFNGLPNSLYFDIPAYSYAVFVQGDPLPTDCAGVINGGALVDDCGVCSGGSTGIVPNSSCADCNGDPNGGALVDDCGVCSGGSTGIVPNSSCADCNGDPNGGALVDDCGVCSGGSTGIVPNSSCADCNGDPNGGALVDDCGVCSGGSTGIVPNSSCADCNGDPNGGALVDDCGVCSGGSTGIVPNSSCADCNGEPNGGALVDDCGVCSGGSTGIVPNSSCADCNGDPNGGALVDDCGVCSGGSTGIVPNSSCADCNGEPNGGALVDDCGVCSGGSTGIVPNSSCADCNGEPNGGALVDDCGVCSGGSTGIVPNSSCADCNGDPNGGALVDDCGVCSGGSTGIVPNSSCADCNGDPNGGALVDDCGVCSGGSTGIVPNSSCADCNGDPNGGALVDDCGVCSGGSTGIVPNSSCADCNGDPNGGALVDDCGVCSGGSTGIVPNSSCADCNGEPNGGAQPGTPCEDGNPNTVGEVWDAQCNCTGGIPLTCSISISEISITAETCPGDADGSITIFADCQGCTEAVYAINGSDFQSSPMFTGLSNGTYTVTVQNAADANCAAVSEAIVVGGLPLPWAAAAIGQAPEPVVSYDNCAGTYQLRSSALNPSSGSVDGLGSILHPLCGDGSITARVADVENGWAGILIRESSDAGARSLSLLSNGTTLYRREARLQPNGAKQSALLMGSPAGWMRLERQGALLRGYRSFNGINWQLMTQVWIGFPDCVEVGLAVHSLRPGMEGQGLFSDVEINGGGRRFAADESAAQPQGLRGGIGIADVPELRMSNTEAFSLGAVVYPNPSTGQVYLQLPSPLLADEPLQLYDVLGQEVYQAVCPAGQAEIGLDLSGLPAGRYLLRVHGQALPLLLTR